MKKTYKLEFRMLVLGCNKGKNMWSEWKHSRAYATEKAREEALKVLNKSEYFQYRKRG